MAAEVILAGDVGGTKTHLALHKVLDGRLESVADQIYRTREYASLEEVCANFLGGRPAPAAACFGVPGPVIAGVSHATNVPWQIEEKSLAAALRVRALRLINDLEATARGVLDLGPGETVVLQSGEPNLGTNLAVIAAGTGLGEAGLVSHGGSYTAVASEGGHCDFAPRGDEQIELMRFVVSQFGHASYERVLSGPGLFNIYRFLQDRMDEPEPPWLTERLAREDPAAVIGEVGVAGGDLRCERSLDLFVAIYGAEAANLALKFMALGGIFLGGGIAPKILSSLQGGGFMRAFNDKGRLGELLRRIEVRVILNQATALIGAARSAAELL